MAKAKNKYAFEIVILDKMNNKSRDYKNYYNGYVTGCGDRNPHCNDPSCKSGQH